MLAPLTWPTRAASSGAIRGADVGDRLVGDAEQHGVAPLEAASAAPIGRASRTSMPASSAALGKRAAHAATANDHREAALRGDGE